MKKTGIMKKALLILLVLFVLSVLFDCGGSSGNQGNGNGQQESSNAKSEKTVYDEIDVQFDGKFPNDVTGNWRSASVKTDHVIEDYVIDYANDRFKSDEEIHFLYNHYLGTENVIHKNGNELTVYVNEYVEDQERNAETAGTGMSLSWFIINMDTGEIYRPE